MPRSGTSGTVRHRIDAMHALKTPLPRVSTRMRARHGGGMRSSMRRLTMADQNSGVTSPPERVMMRA
ncbi:unnamed protein product [Tuwongella immobilis]|uniref:Uncharacterized protein n=1 Tax=Tuwongella immobilis TaxID=692036 RepID=A0A6C2YRA4_9BACT|nr:unnamed protein product [Tuwongella immobilis]VTS05399.1 unnamed protein product [Tuwongella immobilis]